jgi:hypothetical protein
MSKIRWRSTIRILLDLAIRDGFGSIRASAAAIGCSRLSREQPDRPWAEHHHDITGGNVPHLCPLVTSGACAGKKYSILPTVFHVLYR